MTFKAAGANNLAIKTVNHITYLQRPSGGFVTVLVNKHQLVGHYPTQANAEDAVAGILIRLGCKDTATRLAAIPTTTVNLTPSGADVTPTAGSWADMTHTRDIETIGGVPVNETNSYGSSQLQVTGIAANISFRINLSNTDVALYYRKSNLTIPPGVTIDPADPLSGFTRIMAGEQIVVSPNDFIRFKGRGSGTVSNSTLATIENTTNSTIFDTFTMTYTFTETPGI